MIHDGLSCTLENYHMGITAENINEEYGVTREEQDEFAARNQEKGLFDKEIVSVEVPQRKKDSIVRCFTG